MSSFALRGALLTWIAFVGLAPLREGPTDWHGFNLLGFFSREPSPGRYEQSDFACIHEIHVSINLHRAPRILRQSHRVPAGHIVG